MNDRELLELAAKAVGQWPSPEPFDHVLSRWNPLADDGDALRLAVVLHLLVRVGYGGTCVEDGELPKRRSMRIVESHGDDPRAATRRAIVRAAAALATSRADS